MTGTRGPTTATTTATTTPAYDRWGITAHHGDCLTVMRTMPDASVHAIITDPPSGTGFMGKGWDTNHGGRTQWVQWLTERMTQAHRVLKPGGHALVWALPRTSHWTALALEDAGFDIRDCITHLYGSGFPKSLDVSKAIDKQAGVQREVIGVQLDRWTNKGTVLNFANDRPQATVFIQGDPFTDSACEWNGWGTALKPSSEHWWLVRKPFTGTVAGCVLQHGTGAINIDATRIQAGQDYRDKCASVAVLDSNTNGDTYGEWNGTRQDSAHTAGRWPPNTVLSHSALLDPNTGDILGDACADGCVDGCPVAELDVQSGTRPAGGKKVGNEPSRSGHADQSGYRMRSQAFTSYDDSGGVSRFFPCFRWEAKAPTAERPMVNGKAHPTVKPVDLMRWMCRLINPPGGTILDLFAGTGTTGQAARAEGFPAILIENDPTSIELIRARLDAQPKTTATATGTPTEPPPQDLFDLLGNTP